MDGYLINFRIGFRKLSLQSWITYWTEKLKHNYRMANHLKPDFLMLSFLVSSPTWSGNHLWWCVQNSYKNPPISFLPDVPSSIHDQSGFHSPCSCALALHWCCVPIMHRPFNRRILEVCWFTQLNLSFWTTPSQKAIAQISVPQSLVSNNRAGISAWLHGLFFLPQHDPRWGPSPEIIAMQRTYTFLHVSPGWTSLKLQKDKELGFLS